VGRRFLASKFHKTPNNGDILERGFLPENIPPVLTSTKIAQQFSTLPAGYLITKECTGAWSPYSASKRGAQRRIFSLPHPSFIYDSGVFFAKHWKEVAPLFSNSTGSQSRPQFTVGGARSVRITPHSELPKIRLQKLSRFKYCLVTDISRCFPSIYTHSIPWAINGKTLAKIDRKSNSATVFGNRLDFITRQSQDGQTMGIPIGPDTSKVISEFILCAIDKEFQELSGSAGVKFVRHVDDYWIGGDSIEECEGHLQKLRSALKEFELDINELKTRIVETINVFGEHWPADVESEIKASMFGGSYYFSKNTDPVSALSKIIQLSVDASDDGIVKHAIRKLDELRCWSLNWEVLEHFLAQCAVQFPHSFDYVARVVAWRRRKGQPIDKDLWSDVVKTVAFRASNVGRDSEVIWALWLMKELKVHVTSSLAASILKNNNPIVLALLSHMSAKGLVGYKKFKEDVWATVDGNEFAGKNWPLTLELSFLGIAKPGYQTALGAEEPLRMLHDNGVSLIDWEALPAVFNEENADQDAWGESGPGHAIEAYTSDYDDDDDDDDFDFMSEENDE
jgi:hypothetical protein